MTNLSENLKNFGPTGKLTGDLITSVQKCTVDIDQELLETYSSFFGNGGLDLLLSAIEKFDSKAKIESLISAGLCCAAGGRKCFKVLDTKSKNALSTSIATIDSCFRVVFEVSNPRVKMEDTIDVNGVKYFLNCSLLSYFGNILIATVFNTAIVDTFRDKFDCTSIWKLSEDADPNTLKKIKMSDDKSFGSTIRLTGREVKIAFAMKHPFNKNKFLYLKTLTVLYAQDIKIPDEKLNMIKKTFDIPNVAKS